MADDREIQFRPLALGDLELMHRWLNNDFVARWWPGWPSLEQVRAKYRPRIEGNDPTKCFIVEVEATPTGFIQCYYIRDYPDYPIGPEAANAAGIDLFIGERERAYRGLGPRLIREFLGRVVFASSRSIAASSVPHKIIAPRFAHMKRPVSNTLKTVSIPGELEPEYLMRIGRDEFATETAMSDRPEYSAIILAGGRSSRMGRPKAELSFDGGTMLDYIVAEMMRVFEDLVVAVAEPKLFAWEGYGARSDRRSRLVSRPRFRS